MILIAKTMQNKMANPIFKEYLMKLDKPIPRGYYDLTYDQYKEKLKKF